jgi:hypothetical protein
MSKPVKVHRDLCNEFEALSGTKTINFRNEGSKRDSVSSIEIHNDGEHIKDIRVKEEDNVAMALAILGIGRVTDNVERRAQDRADLIMNENSGSSIDGNLDQAIVNLRAILIAREKQAETFKKDLDDAYALYKLAYPDAAVTRSEFPDQSMSKFWITNLSKIRQDPTVLGSL